VRPPLPTLPPHPTIQLPYSHNYFFPIPDMSPSPSESFQLLFETALQDYEKQTGMKLIDHPLARRLETCDSVDSITSILQEQVQAFRNFRGDDGKVMKSLKCAVHVLYTLSNSTALSEGVGLPFPPAKAVFASFAMLLAAAKDLSASYDTLVDLFESIEHFLSRLDIYTKIPLNKALKDVVIKIMVALLSTLAVATKQIKQGRSKKFMKKLFGEAEVEALLQRLDRLTQDEARSTATQSLEAVYGLVQNIGIVMDDGKAIADDIRQALEIMNQLRSESFPNRTLLFGTRQLSHR